MLRLSSFAQEDDDFQRYIARSEVTGRTPVIAHHLIPHLLLLPHLLVVAPHVHGHALALAHHRDGQRSICTHHAITHTQSWRKAAKGQRTGMRRTESTRLLQWMAPSFGALNSYGPWESWSLRFAVGGERA